MTEETIVAVYDTVAHADAAAASLKAAGVPADAIGLHAAGGGSYGAQGTPAHEEGFWASLFGGEPDHDTAVYDRSVAAGSTVVSVKVPEAHIARVLDILESHNPIDIDERAASYGLPQTDTVTRPAVAPGTVGSATALSSTPASDATLQLAEETLAIGKRVVNRGGTRVRRFVVETPVEKEVSLHSEKVVLERRPVTGERPVAGDFTDKTIEMTESSEEPVVSKTARVYEEVGLRKDVSDRVETVRDTVRKQEAEIVQVPAGEAAVTDAARAARPLSNV